MIETSDAEMPIQRGGDTPTLFRTSEPHLGAQGEFSQPKSAPARVHVPRAPHARLLYLPNYIPGFKYDTKKKARLPCVGFQAESAKLHRNLDSDKIQPKAVG
jgi:hypothetical protein